MEQAVAAARALLGMTRVSRAEAACAVWPSSIAARPVVLARAGDRAAGAARDRRGPAARPLSRSGRVLQVRSRFPAIELLWHHADRVVVRMASTGRPAGHSAALLDRPPASARWTPRSTVLDTGLLTLRDATLYKRGNSSPAAPR